ncbi:MAG: beta-ketoacyl-[acyl-carrier-protein] synthase family protein [Bdellovibrionota bacterium]
MHNVHATALSFESPLGNDFGILAVRLRDGISGVRKLTPDEIPPDFPIQYAAKIGARSRAANEDGKKQSPYSYIARQLTADFTRQIAPGLEIDGLVCSYRELNSFSIAYELFQQKIFPSGKFDFLDRDGPLRSISESLNQFREISIPDKNQIVMSSACVSSTCALGLAFQKIRRGEWKRALVAAIELDPHPLQLMTLFLLGALSTGVEDPQAASRPFSKSRNGFVKGEAAGLILLESSAAMRERGAESFGEILGYSTTSDAWRLTEGRPNGAELIAAMELALADAGVTKEQIGYIKAHGTSTPTGDQIEAEAIKNVFGSRADRIPVSSVKSLLGHSTHAAGLMEFICSLSMLEGQFVAGNRNLTDPDPAISSLGLDLVGNHSRPHSFDHALLNSSGFGGQNACLVVKKPAGSPAKNLNS